MADTEGERRLFEPTTVAGLSLRNRVVMSPMTRSQAVDGVLKPSAYYRKRAEGEVGLIITEAVAIDHPVADFTRNCPLFGAEAQQAAWGPVLDAVHAAGAPMVMQLWHTGLKRKVEQSFNPHLPSFSPSGVYPGWEVASAPMSEADIAAVIEAYGKAAHAAQKAGFDGVEVHAAHGYLIDEFFWSVTNRRADRWGGDIAGRARFGAEVVREIRRRTGPTFPIFFRFSQWKTDFYDAKLAETPDELARLLQPLADAGVDVFDASTRRFWVPEFEGSDLNLAGWARKLTGRAAMTVGSVGLDIPLDNNSSIRGGPAGDARPQGLSRLYEMLARGDFDLVGVGRGLLANPDWPRLVRQGRMSELAPYTDATPKTALI